MSFRKIMEMDSKANGFTLIELIMVIVMLGILAAFALPKFADLSADARKATVESAAGALKATLKIARAEWYLQGAQDGVLVVMEEGISITFFYGWPAVANGGAVGVGHQDISLLLDGAESFDIDRDPSAGGSWIDFAAKGASSPDNCKVRYFESHPSRNIYLMEIDVSDCS